MSKIIRKMQGFWIWTLLSCLTNLNWVNSGKHPYAFNLNSNLEWFCKWLCNTLLLDGIIHTSETLPHLYNITSCSTFSIFFHGFKCTWNSSINQMEFEFAFQMQYTPFNWNKSHISDTYIKFQPSTHMLEHCLIIVSMFVLFVE